MLVISLKEGRWVKGLKEKECDFSVEILSVRGLRDVLDLLYNK